MKNQLAAANLDDSVIRRQIAIIDSMTPKERRNPDLLKASRKKRIAAGSGTTPEAINKLLKMHRGMSDMMKMMGGAKRGPLAGLAQAMGFSSGMPSPEQLAQMAKNMPGGQLPPNMPGSGALPPTMPKLPPNMPGLPGLPGLGGKFPGLPGGLPPGLGKKK
jgi:signal recognition particle subunit SRP54